MILSNKKYKQGFSLIEMIIFIVIVSITATTILAAMEMILKGSVTTEQHAAATQIASRCLEWYEGQYQMNGYDTLTCPSTTVPSFCSAPSGFNVAVNVACTTLFSESTANYKTVSVTVTGKGSANLSLIIGKDS